MRKVVPIGAIVAGLVFAAAAFAVTNTYTVSASVSPAKSGTKKKPTPIGLHFNYTVGEVSGKRPANISQYAIGFGGIRVNSAAAKTCTAAQINNSTTSPQKNGICPAGSAVGTGNVENLAGPTSDPTNKATACHLDLTIYNSGPGRAALYLFGNSTRPKPCPIAIDQAIDAHYVAGPDGGSSLVFKVDPTLLHPIPGFDNSVVQVASSINKITKRVHGKTIGYYSTVGGCKHKKRRVTVTFTTEAGQSTTTGTTVPCK